VKQLKLRGTSTTYYVEYDGEEFRTTDGKFWEASYPECWESEYLLQDELTEAFAGRLNGPQALEWHDCRDKKPPQNEHVLWLNAHSWTDDDGSVHWTNGGVSEGVYRFGMVKALSGTFSIQESPYRRVFWSRYTPPEGIG